jgi:hypothetical protein
MTFIKFVLLGLSLLLTVGACTFLRPEVDGRSESAQLIKVSPSQNLQSVIDRARPGDVIELEAGKVYSGPIKLPVKSGDSFITIQSSRAAELAEGVRVGPAQPAMFAKIQSSTPGEPVIRTVPGSHHYRFVGLEISTTAANLRIYDLVRIGESRQTAADVPHDLVIDRSWIHGFDTQEVQRGVSLNGGEITVSNSYISEIHGQGYDTQALCGWNGPGPFHIINNYLEASGENILFGGADPSISNLVPSNIEIRSNYLFKPLRWKMSDPSYAGIHWTVKNLLEIKMGRNVVIDGNVLENSWGDAQIGYAVLFTVRNQDGKAPWATIEKVSFTNNIVKNSEQGFQLLGADNLHVSQRANDLRITNNLFTGISNRFLTMTGYPNVTLNHNTHFQGGNIMIFDGEPSTGFVYTDNITIRGPNGYGIHGSGVGEGIRALEHFVPGHNVKRNIFISANASQYPPNNAYPATVEEVGFQDYAGGNYRLATKSKFKGIASDKTDPGCQVDRLPSH